MPKDTADVLGKNAKNCNSRSLLLDRFADPAEKGDNRKAVFDRVVKLVPCREKLDAWQTWLVTAKSGHPSPEITLLYAQLQSRLMVNMAGGVMENAGLCIDRFGLPYIPGSAVKGCARRAALVALNEWCSAIRQPAYKPVGGDNPLALCCDTFPTPAHMLATIATVFGWCELDWPDSSDQSNQSDFCWACGDQWIALRDKARSLLASQPPEHYSGSISFLPAYPVRLGNSQLRELPIKDLPAPGTLELDVVTPHHSKYYSGELGTATDTEDPIPVVFPAVAAGQVFGFPIVPLRRADESLVQHARNWLATGLSVFGVGAKTNAGYGWFIDVTQSVFGLVSAEQERLAEEAAKKAAHQRAAAEATAKARAEEERLAKAPPHERFRAEYAKLEDEPFAAQAKKFAELTDDQRYGFALALKERRDTAKRWAKKKPELIKPWQEFAQRLQPPIQLP